MTKTDCYYCGPKCQPGCTYAAQKVAEQVAAVMDLKNGTKVDTLKGNDAYALKCDEDIRLDVVDDTPISGVWELLEPFPLRPRARN